MIAYLSDEWLTAAGEAVEQSDELKQAAEGQSLTIGYEVTGAPSGKVCYGIVFEDGSVRIESGPQPDAQTQFALDYPTAAEIARGELSAQAAFMQGRLKLTGDVTILVKQYRMIENLTDVLADLRSRTEF